jgi:PAS domain S-box-containing protein
MSSDFESPSSFADTRGRKRIAQPLRDQHSRDAAHNARDLIGLLPAAIYTTDADGRITYYNEAAAELWGCRPHLGKSEFCGSWKLYWPDGTPLPHDECPMALTLKRRRPIRGMEAVAERPDGTRVPFVPYPTPVFDASGNLTGAINMLVDITERKASEQKVRTQARRFELLNQVAKIISSDLDLDRVVQGVIDVATELSGAEFGALFHSVADPHSEGHLLHAVSGASHEAFGKVTAPRSTILLEATFRGTGVIRCDDVHIDARCSKNPLHFLPQGPLPVVSYLAVPLVRWGQVRGGLFLGHSRAGAFTEEIEQVISGIAAHAAIAIDNACHYQAAARLSAIVEDSDDAIVSKNLDGVILSWNKGAERLFGCAAHEVIGTPITIVIPPDRQDEEPRILERIKRGECVDHYETVRQRKDGSRVDISLTVSPVKDATGRIVGASKVARDISARKRAEAIMACQKEALEMIAAGAPLAEVLEYLARAAESHSRQAAMVAIHLLDKGAESFEQTFAPSLPAGYSRTVDGMKIASGIGLCCAAASHRTAVSVPDVAASDEFPAFAAFAAPLGIRSGRSLPILAASGRVLGTTVHYYREVGKVDPHDEILAELIARTAGIIIERKQAEHTLAHSEERFRSLVSVITDVPWVTDAHGAFVAPQSAWSNYTGQVWEDHQGFGWAKALHPDDREDILEKWQEAIARRTPYESSGRLWHAPSRSYRWFEARAMPLVTADGSVREWVGTCTDVDDRKKAQERQELLAREIQHRTKNLFAVVQAVVGRSFAGKETVAKAEAAVMSRLSSLAQTHVLLLDKQWGGIDIAEVVGAEMSPYAGRVRIDGPKLMLHPKAAQNFSLAFHELATNAAKYGALSNATGSVHITWSVRGLNGQRTFSFCWQEQGGPPVAMPERKGFGSTVLEYVMGEYFSEPPRMEFAPSGLRYALTAPVEAILSADQPQSMEGGGDDHSSTDAR